MAFNKIARAVSTGMRVDNERLELVVRGWCQTSVPVHILVDLGIRFEALNTGHIDKRGQYQRTVYAPAWVEAAWRFAESQSGWVIMPKVLQAARDDVKEQELLCTEMSLDLSRDRPARQAAKNYLKLLHGQGPERHHGSGHSSED
jgi:hypothetical protein